MRRDREALRIAIAIAVSLAAHLLLPTANAQDLVDCWRHAKMQPGAYTQTENCGQFRDSDLVRLIPEFLDSTDFDSDGLSCVLFLERGFYWVRQEGRGISVPTWDNKCAWFSNGLSVANVDGRQAFIDKGLNVVLDPGFEVLDLFVDGYARVCNGPFVYENLGEPRITGGKCGLIDQSGELVLDLRYPIEEFAALRDYRNTLNEQGGPAEAEN